MSSPTSDPPLQDPALGDSPVGDRPERLYSTASKVPGEPGKAATGAGVRLRGRDRILGVDAARGVALLAMMSVHLYPEYPQDSAPTERHVAHVLVAGRAAAAFALLAGVALILAMARMPLPAARAATAARAAGIGVIGLALGYAGSGLAVILPYYALLFLLAVPLLGCSARTLAVLAGAAVVVVPVVSHLARPHLPPPTWENPTFGMLVGDPVALLADLAVTGFYPVLAWTAYLCAGMAVGRADLRSPRVAGWLLAGGAGLAVAASGASWLLLGPLGGRDAIAVGFPDPAMVDRAIESGQFGATPTDTWWWLALDAPHASTPFDLAHTVGTSLALLGAVLLLSRVVRAVSSGIRASGGAAVSPVASGGARKKARAAFGGGEGRAPFDPLVPLAAVGTMTLTLYVTHAVLMATDLLPEDPTPSYLLQVAGALVIATAWRATKRRGPAEAAVSALSRAAATGASARRT